MFRQLIRLHNDRLSRGHAKELYYDDKMHLSLWSGMQLPRLLKPNLHRLLDRLAKAR